MGFLIILVVIGAMAAVLLNQSKSKGSKKKPAQLPRSPWPGRPESPAVFYVRSPLTEREQGCYYRLVENLGDHFIVLPQVAFSAFLRTTGGSEKENFALFGTMRQKVADFLICRKDFKVLAVVELDDRSHIGKEAEDKKRDEALKQAGLLVFRIPNTPNGEPIQRLADVLKRLDAAAAETEQALFMASRGLGMAGSSPNRI